MMLLELYTGLFSIMGHTVYTAAEQKATKKNIENKEASLHGQTEWY